MRRKKKKFRASIKKNKVTKLRKKNCTHNTKKITNKNCCINQKLNLITSFNGSSNNTSRARDEIYAAQLRCRSKSAC